jgi:hypothetical protein
MSLFFYEIQFDDVVIMLYGFCLHFIVEAESHTLQGHVGHVFSTLYMCENKL